MTRPSRTPPTRPVQFNVFTRGEVRLVGGRFPSGVGNERLATLRRIRQIVRVTHVVEAGTCASPVRKTKRNDRETNEERMRDCWRGRHTKVRIRANGCLLVKQTRFSTLSPGSHVPRSNLLAKFSLHIVFRVHDLITRKNFSE